MDQKRLRRLAGLPILKEDEAVNHYVGMPYHSLKNDLNLTVNAIKQAKRDGEDTRELETELAFINAELAKYKPQISQSLAAFGESKCLTEGTR